MSMEAIPVFERKLTIFYPIATDMHKKNSPFPYRKQGMCILKNYRAALAVATRASKAGLSFTARSASILRLMSMPAFFRPFMKVL